MGIITNAGCLSRITGPICIMFLYTRFGTFWTFFPMLILCIVPMIILMILKDRLYIESFKPAEKNSLKSVEMKKLNPKSENENDINHR